MSAGASLNACALFSDDFMSGASAQWGNEVGGWTVVSEAYDSTLPSNNPCTYTSLPYDLADFTVNFSVKGVHDGGIWLRSEDNQNGVVLVTYHSYVYFHTVVNGEFSSRLGQSASIYADGDDVNFSVTVCGNSYSVYLNGGCDPVATLSTDLFTSGKVALYDFSNQSFDNVELYGTPIPEPSTAALGLGLGAMALVALRRRKA
jgi:hypothetical protein